MLLRANVSAAMLGADEPKRNSSASRRACETDRHRPFGRDLGDERGAPVTASNRHNVRSLTVPSTSASEHGQRRRDRQAWVEASHVSDPSLLLHRSSARWSDQRPVLSGDNDGVTCSGRPPRNAPTLTLSTRRDRQWQRLSSRAGTQALAASAPMSSHHVLAWNSFSPDEAWSAWSKWRRSYARRMAPR